jgi:putative ABC transport system ATP-binding protein
VSDAYVVAEGLSASYGEGDLRVPVLRDASFSIERGSVTAIVGASGSGKTTLLSLIGGLDAPEAGRLLVDGADIGALSRSALGRYRRERVGFVFQFFHLLPSLTARENVEAGLDPLRLPRRTVRSKTDDALDRVGLLGKADRFPHELSGGEQQRVAVARAWAKDPPLLLADEPTGNLDEESGGQVLDLLFGRASGGRGAAAGRTTVVVTHDADVAARADRSLRLHAHRVDPA